MGSVRDPVHGFVSYDEREEAVINSAAFQRLRFIGQLATTQWLYPGAKHSRFEHSIGVMHLATRIFDKVWPRVVQVVPAWEQDRDNMRQLLRLAALLHDVGHPAFSHAFEEHLPNGSHEYFTGRFILEDAELHAAFGTGGIPMSQEIIAVIALGAKKRERFFPELFGCVSSKSEFLNQILTGDLVGADRMDYLLRDSLHAGVSYGRFDLERVLDTLTVVVNEAGDPQLAIERGGLEAAEEMLLARYYMFAQIYFHHVRCILDQWIGRALLKVFPDTERYENLDEYRTLTDDVVQVRVREAWSDGTCEEGEVFFARRHPRLAYRVPNFIFGRFAKKKVMDEYPHYMSDLETSLDRFLSRRATRTAFTTIQIDSASITERVRHFPVYENLPGADRPMVFGAVSRVLERLPRIQALYVYSLDPNERTRIEGYCEEWENSPRTLPNTVSA